MSGREPQACVDLARCPAGCVSKRRREALDLSRFKPAATKDLVYAGTRVGAILVAPRAVLTRISLPLLPLPAELPQVWRSFFWLLLLRSYRSPKLDVRLRAPPLVSRGTDLFF